MTRRSCSIVRVIPSRWPTHATRTTRAASRACRKDPPLIRETAAGVEVDVRVIPRARKTACSGFRDKLLLVRVAAPPVEGAANDALIAYFAEALGVPRRSIRILSGDRGRQKRVAIAGVTADQIRALG